MSLLKRSRVRKKRTDRNTLSSPVHSAEEAAGVEQNSSGEVFGADGAERSDKTVGVFNKKGRIRFAAERNGRKVGSVGFQKQAVGRDKAH